MTIDHWHTAPTLRGDYVLLRPTELSDTAALARVYDVETTRYFLYGSESGPPTEETVRRALNSGRQVLTQIEVATGEVIGTTSIYQMNQMHRRVTVGYTWLSSRVRGSAINSEAKLLLLEHSFTTLGAGRVEFNVDELNERSRRAVLAIGATEEGALRRHARRRDGTWRTTIVYSVIDEEWPAVRAALIERIAARGP
ncbi:MAG TPA: GNAT family protein [Mycobacterium sp.]|nr:GNAT family protein [Mycobacterium sp.]